MREGKRPAARTRDVVVRTVGDEVLVYDVACHRAHRLNPVVAAGARDVPARAAAET